MNCTVGSLLVSRDLMVVEEEQFLELASRGSYEYEELATSLSSLNIWPLLQLSDLPIDSVPSVYGTH